MDASQVPTNHELCDLMEKVKTQTDEATYVAVCNALKHLTEAKSAMRKVKQVVARQKATIQGLSATLDERLEVMMAMHVASQVLDARQSLHQSRVLLEQHLHVRPFIIPGVSQPGDVGAEEEEEQHDEHGRSE